MVKVLITGITGQDGSYLAEHLLKNGDEVHGVLRRSSNFNTARIDHIFNKLVLHHGDVTDALFVSALLRRERYDEVYNLAAQSHVKVSFELPLYTAHTDALGALNFLDAIATDGLTNTKFYQASTSEMYGNVPRTIINENTPFKPVSPYAAAKLYAHNMVDVYRSAYGIPAVSGILFNHESPRRGKTFVTRKITNYFYNYADRGVYNGPLLLGNLDAMRDWGHAEDYVKAMVLMMRSSVAKDYIVATGTSYSVREFVEAVAKYYSVSLDWYGSGADEIAVDKRTQKPIIKIDPNLFRPNEVPFLMGDSTPIRKNLGWMPIFDFQTLVEDMCSDEGINGY